MPKCTDCENFSANGSCCVMSHPPSFADFDTFCSTFVPKAIEKIIPEIRTFSTGATRDTDANKPNYIKALSPIVLQSYVEYLGKHRTLPDGSMRDWDNWKSGLPKEVCLESLGRHEMAVWLLMQGFSASDNYGPVTLEDSLCGVIFNASCILHEILKAKEQK